MDEIDYLLPICVPENAAEIRAIHKQLSLNYISAVGQAQESLERVAELEERVTIRTEGINHLHDELDAAGQRIAELDAENNALQKQVYIDTTRFKEIEAHGLAMKAENAKLQAENERLTEGMELEEWIAVSDQWPYDDCDVKLRDGSIIRNVIPQSDRDFYWQSPFGEVFICEFSVTHWTGCRRGSDE